MDEYTAGVIIALTKENPVAAAHLFASTREQYGPTKDDAVNIERMIGKRCIVSWNIPGVIVGVNESSGGIYNGARYPLCVRQDTTGKVFEYGFEGFRLIDEA